MKWISTYLNSMECVCVCTGTSFSAHPITQVSSTYCFYGAILDSYQESLALDDESCSFCWQAGIGSCLIINNCTQKEICNRNINIKKQMLKHTSQTMKALKTHGLKTQRQPLYSPLDSWAWNRSTSCLIPC